MSNILVIGNGFDLYHELPTRYTDFLEFIKDWEEFYQLYQVSKSPLEQTKLPLASQITSGYSELLAMFGYLYNEKNITLLNNIIQEKNIWLIYFTNLKEKSGLWIDFEREIEKVLCDIINIFSDDDRTKHRLTDFSLSYRKKYDKSINEPHSNFSQTLNTIKEELNGFIKAMEIYFSEIIDKADVYVYSKQILDIDVDKIISFNYTRTYEKIYPNLRYDNKIPQSHNIHGMIRKNNIVLGIKDENNTIDDRFVYFKKYFQRIQKRTGLQYKQWIDGTDEQSSENQIYVIGHSLDETDGDLFRELINSENTARVTFFYHNQRAYEEQVINLIKVLGKDNFLRRYYEKIIFKQLEPSIALRKTEE